MTHYIVVEGNDFNVFKTKKITVDEGSISDLTAEINKLIDSKVGDSEGSGRTYAAEHGDIVYKLVPVMRIRLTPEKIKSL